MKPFAYCPLCAAPLKKGTHGERERLACPQKACNFVHWNNPTPVVAAIIEHRKGILLVRNKGWPEKWFALVTGFLEQDEVPEEGVLRELKEETNLDGTIVSFVGHYNFPMLNQLILAYHIRAEGEITLNEELEESKFIPLAKLRPWPMATGEAVRDWLKIYRDTPKGQLNKASPHTNEK